MEGIGEGIDRREKEGRFLAMWVMEIPAVCGDFSNVSCGMQCLVMQQLRMFVRQVIDVPVLSNFSGTRDLVT